MNPRTRHNMAELIAIALLCASVQAETKPPADAATRPAPPPRTGVLSPDYNRALPTDFLIGDSTVKNSWDVGSGGLWGWGRPLAAYFDRSKINVENQALGGTSSRSYITAGHWQRVLALVKPGDYVLMQFGHNDGGPAGSIHGTGDETRDGTDRAGQKETVHSYGWYLRKYIADTRAKGATPIVCSPIPRNDWKDGKVVRSTGSYATWAQESAQAGGAYFIDLNSLIADRYDELGQERVRPFFPKEHTHTGWDGALLNAQCVVEGIKQLKDCPLAGYLSANPQPKEPAAATRP
jgi:rhamnogalacturonan acetylesterase